ncbi:hypothetical protein [Streptomyces sp. 7N604]|uniref:hypothetical protein n=1 Tax=Streptomyces sp. 7N604 TaxID=3457415 RepID=UPI003FD2249A
MGSSPLCEVEGPFGLDNGPAEAAERIGAAGRRGDDGGEPAAGDDALAGVRDYASDPEQAARLWTLSAELTGIDAFAATA